MGNASYATSQDAQIVLILILVRRVTKNRITFSTAVDVNYVTSKVVWIVFHYHPAYLVMKIASISWLTPLVKDVHSKVA